MIRYSPDSIAKQLEDTIQKNLSSISQAPTLHVIQVGHDFSSTTYIELKRKKCQSFGIPFVLHHFEETANAKQIQQTIADIPQNAGLIIQLPLPGHLQHIVDTIPPRLDIDMLGKDASFAATNILPPTICAIDSVITDMVQKKDYTGLSIAVVGQGTLVGTPLVSHLLRKHATIISIDKHTKNPQLLTKQADIVVSAASVKNLIDKNWVHERAKIIDAATFESDGAISGDVNIENLFDTNMVCPSPGGIGKLTILSLIQNLIVLANRKDNK
jgi:methylenetetrahydrofolate dehydrogenase (NADP+) / methenyltetrahydrofolate cyclohydrolase